MDILDADTISQASGVATGLLGVVIWRVLVPLGNAAKEAIEFLQKASAFIDTAEKDLTTIKEALELPAEED